MSGQEGVAGGSDDKGRVWSQTTVRINLGDYESIQISLGASVPMTVNSSARRNRKQTELMQEHERLISERIEEIRALWSNKHDY